MTATRLVPSSLQARHRGLAALAALSLAATLLGACCASAPAAPTAVTPEPTPGESPAEPGPGLGDAPQKGGDEVLAARCSAPMDYSTLTLDEAAAWRAECKPAFDCTQPLPPKACCLALTPECEQCVADGKSRKAAFDYACFGETSPMPETADCSAPPPLTPCCKALLPKCLDCVAKNRYLAALHAEQCGK